ncbi:MAG TPA: hypothetical protein VKE74_11575 [Gemmataceae bacterium]|nr:hypothetical protein [Gemmataceae bacterium]
MTDFRKHAVIAVPVAVFCWCYITYGLLGPIGPALVLAALGFSGYHIYRFWSSHRRR